MAAEDSGIGTGISSGSNTFYTFPSVTLKKSPGILFNAGTLSNVRTDQYTIKLKVTIYHNGTAYDVTPYIMQLRTHMGLGEPAGRFSLLLSFQKRWDKFVQAQDYVEIQYARYLKVPPVMMRALVSNVRRTRIMDESGKLHRVITINGENYGKLWKQYDINYLVSLPGQTNLGGVDTDPAAGLMFPMLTENYGIGAQDIGGPVAPGDLMQGITDKMLNAQVRVMQQINPQMPLLKCIPTVLPEYQINWLQIQQVQGKAFSLVQQFGNAPWCEWIIDDFTDGAVFFYRNTPFKGEDGQYIFPESEPDKDYFLYPVISDIDIIEEDVGKSDGETYSYFFTYPSTYLIDQFAFKAQAIASEGIDSLAEEADPTTITNPHVVLDHLYRYGFQKLELGSPCIQTNDFDTGLALTLKLNRWLVKAFNWTPFMYNGTIRMKGNEHMRIGRYFLNTSTNEEYYIESVDHVITIGQTDSIGNDNVYNFQTTVGVTRGRELK
ncbi:hypothetical protein SD70_02550 [Gordoniibacillus kamchatkensis]|uniref:Uncharacterized protein n=1 Tax=Gordoniibacillus kamchatkensis TaxID=1590651 RepID=A0ABR5AMK0_9BACL|nr:hypothetical protein [Paenibacillus sp. VKM B-2647]KIL42083.1 hypothetical protein SD70_02550 [Paenibacillus sp. VKM B-2647]